MCERATTNASALADYTDAIVERILSDFNRWTDHHGRQLLTDTPRFVQYLLLIEPLQTSAILRLNLYLRADAVWALIKDKQPIANMLLGSQESIYENYLQAMYDSMVNELARRSPTDPVMQDVVTTAATLWPYAARRRPTLCSTTVAAAIQHNPIADISTHLQYHVLASENPAAAEPDWLNRRLVDAPPTAANQSYDSEEKAAELARCAELQHHRHHDGGDVDRDEDDDAEPKAAPEPDSAPHSVVRRVITETYIADPRAATLAFLEYIGEFPLNPHAAPPEADTDDDLDNAN